MVAILTWLCTRLYICRARCMPSCSVTWRVQQREPSCQQVKLLPTVISPV